MSICIAPKKYPMIVRKVCPYCGKGNDILIHRWQENRQRMFCPGTNHASLIKRKNGGIDEANEIADVEVAKPLLWLSERDSEYKAQLRKAYNLK